MTRRTHFLLAAACGLVLAFLGGSLLLPSGLELVRHRDLPHPRSALHPWIADPARWSRWAPPWMSTEGDPAEIDRLLTSVREQLGQFIRSEQADTRPATGQHHDFRVRH